MSTKLTTALASAIAAATLCTVTFPVAAVPVLLSFSDTVNFSNVTGANVGGVFTLDVIVDNGGTSLISQTWDQDDFVSVSVSAGPSYSAFANILRADSFANVQTDAGGNLSMLDIGQLNVSGIDSNGQTLFEFFMNDANEVWYYNDIDSVQTGLAIGASDPPDIQNTRIAFAPVSVPAPGSLALFALGVLGVLALRRRKVA